MALIHCPECMREVSDRAPTCPDCGFVIAVDISKKPQSLGDDMGIRMLLPVGRSGWAIAAGYLALFSVLCFPAPFALIAGILAVREIKRNSSTYGMGRAVFGIIMGGLGTIVLLLMLISFLLTGR